MTCFGYHTFFTDTVGEVGLLTDGRLFTLRTTGTGALSKALINVLLS